MPTRKLRWGLLSTARINRALIGPLRVSARNELVAVASRNAAQAEAYAHEWNIPRAFGSYAAMLADPDIDVIFNPLPNGLHAEWTIKAAQAGKHVLCEKPLAVSVEEVDAMASAAAQAGVIVAEAFMYRHHPQPLKVKELVEQGAVGELRWVRGAFTFNLDHPDDVRLDPALGGGSIWDVGCYPISYAHTMIGMEPIEAFGWQVTGPTGVDETFVGQLRFPGEVYAQFSCSFRAPYRTHIEIVGSEGTISIPRPFRPDADEHVYLTRGDETQTLTLPGQEPYLGEVEDLADAVLLGKTPRISLADSRGNVAAIVALLRSARERVPISLA
ncbi:MAG TPA: Gfo/Idh/MocA family oxidoreductase [Anaerolineae bacterium]|nr:Gfo/Idh/MocA family oxidoreductase [Anaerolineae bacterium]